MDRSIQHAFGADEIMAYLDGELEPRRAASLAAHLVSCGECQEVAKGFRAVSERLMNFEVAPAPAGIGDTVREAGKAVGTTIPAGPERLRWWNRRRLFTTPYAWAFAAWIIAAVLFSWGVSTFQRSRTRTYLATERTTSEADQRLNTEPVHVPGPGLTQSPSLQAESSEARDETSAPAPAPQADSNGLYHGLGDHAANSSSVDGQPVIDELHAPETVGPMIVQTASLSIVATKYDEASAAIERLASAHDGYVEKLDAKAQTGSARELSAALRVPAKQLGGFLADLRTLGHVQEESRGNEEVSALYVDLQARLNAARATEQRLIELLGTRTGKLSDVLDAERELARIRGEIESMQGQNAVLVHRVSYATVQVQLSEIYRKQLTTDSWGTKIRNAFVEGLGNLEEGATSLLLFVLAYGPSILFWLAILLVPAWLIGRRIRSQTKA